MTRILYVEDDNIVAELCQQWLKDAGYEVVFAEDGATALAAALSQPKVDAIILDIRVPLLDGNEVVRRIRAAQPNHHTPVIALTATVTPTEYAQSVAAGIDEFVFKPVSRREFLPALQDFLHRFGIATP
jgi:CheY-like chemotaxis protein